MFPHLPPSSIAYDLSRTGSVEITTNNILARNSLPPVSSHICHTNSTRRLPTLRTTNFSRRPNHRNHHPHQPSQRPQNQIWLRDTNSTHGYQKTSHRSPSCHHLIRERERPRRIGVNLRLNGKRTSRRRGMTWYYERDDRCKSKRRRSLNSPLRSPISISPINACSIINLFPIYQFQLFRNIIFACYALKDIFTNVDEMLTWTCHDWTGAVNESCSVDPIGICEHSFFQTDHNKLRASVSSVCEQDVPLEASFDQPTDVLGMTEIERCVNFVQDIHRRRFELQQTHDKCQGNQRPNVRYRDGGSTVAHQIILLNSVSKPCRDRPSPPTPQ